MITVINESQGIVTVDDSEGRRQRYDIESAEGFMAISRAWLRAGWDTKYVYGFSWLGRPVIQLPEDMLRIQEVIYNIKPDVIVETGVAHGGSLIFYASLCTAIGKGRVIGIDIEIRPHNRTAIEEHRLSPMISLVEGSSIDPQIVQSVKDQIGVSETVLVLLDSNHLKDHVLAELEAYSLLVSSGSYIVACDGIMKQVVGAPRTQDDWSWNNPLTAIDEFLQNHPEFECVEPNWPFNEGVINERVTYWPRAFLRKNHEAPGMPSMSTIRAHNRAAIEAHPMASRIQMIQGSSIAPEIIEQVQAAAQGHERILVCLDSNHTHDHVLAELHAYAPLVTPGSDCVVFDTIIEDLPADMFPDRPWGPGNNPKTAVQEYLKTHPAFEIDKQIDHKLLISVAPDGYLRRVG